MEKNERITFFKTSIWKTSLLGSITVILIAVFRWTIFEIITPFLGIWLLLMSLVVIIVSIVFQIKNLRKYKYYILLPILLNLIALYILIFDPFSGILIDADYSRNTKGRQNVIMLIQNDNIEFNKTSENYGFAILPAGKKGLSSGGKVRIYQDGKNLKVFFYTYRGVLDNFSGFIYTEVPNDPSPKSLGCDPVQLEKKSDHWYWVSCT